MPLIAALFNRGDGRKQRLGREPNEMEHSNPGFDIESRDPKSGTVYFIEVKGRIQGRDTVNIKARQIRRGDQQPREVHLGNCRCAAR